MDWSQSYSSQWRVYRVNRDTWADAEAVNKVDSASITRTTDGNMLEAGRLAVTGNFERDYYRIVMIANQGGEVERVDVATLLFESRGGTRNYGTDTHDVDGHSVLYPASTTTVLIGQYAPSGYNGALYAAELLESAINAPVHVEGSFTLGVNVVHEIGSTVLDAVWSVLAAGGFIMQIDGRGEVHIKPRPTDPALTINSESIRLMSNGIDIEADASEIPNRYVVIDDVNVTIATNNDPASEVSTVARGYNVDEVDTSPTPVNNETYAQYAERRLMESSVLKDARTYQREYAPDVYPYSIVRGSINGLDGDFRVASQDITCSHGINVKEKAYKEIELWSIT